MPDTILPPANAATSNSNTPRSGTPQPDISAAAGSGWAGWAISSFTNKLAAATGEIQAGAAKPNGVSPIVQAAATEPSRPSSSSASTLARQALNASAPASNLTRNFSTPTISTPETTIEPDVEDDFDTSWGAIDDGPDDDGGNAFFDALSSNSNNASATKPATSPTPFDDGGEPDFAGWLNAQSKAKIKSPLPKGLNRGVKSPTAATSSAGAAKAAPNRKGIPTRPTVAKSISSPPATASKPKVIDTKPKDEDGDGSGAWDAWD